MKAKSLTYGLIIGGVIGSISSLLSTPSSGRELRSQIKGKKEDWSQVFEEMKVHLGELKDSISTLSQEGKETVQQISKDLQASVKQWQASTEPNNQKLQQEIQLIQSKIEELETSLNNNNQAN
jgi:gas vesicle protein